MTIYDFMSDSPWLSFFLAIVIAQGIKFIINRLLRHMNIRRHGWAPVHCDADGDLKDADE